MGETFPFLSYFILVLISTPITPAYLERVDLDYTQLLDNLGMPCVVLPTALHQHVLKFAEHLLAVGHGVDHRLLWYEPDARKYDNIYSAKRN